MNCTPALFAISAAHALYRPEPRSTWPSFHRLRTVSESTIGVAPFAFVSAIIVRMYQPKLWTTSCFFVSRLSIDTESGPSPGKEPRARSESLIAPPSLWPNSMSTMSPGFTPAIRSAHRPSETKVRLLRPPRARLTTFTFVVSKYSAKGTAHPCCLAPAPRAAVELPATQMVGRALVGAGDEAAGPAFGAALDACGVRAHPIVAAAIASAARR